MSNLRLLNETTVGSSVTTVNVEDVFSADFDVYKIVIPQMNTVGTASTDVALRFINSSGSVISSSNYDYANLGLRAYTTYTIENDENVTYIQKFGQADQEPDGTSIVSYIFNPFSDSIFTYVLQQNSFNFGSGQGGGKGIGVLTELVSITGYQLVAVSSTRPFTTSKIRTYGLRLDS